MLRLPQNMAFYASVVFLNLAVAGIITGFVTGWGVKKADTSILVSAFAHSKTMQPRMKSGVPAQLVIPSLGLELPVKPGTYSLEEGWALDDSNAFFATPSVPVNNLKGTTLIYGHNTQPVFKRLTRLLPGAKLEVITEDGARFTYEYSFVSEVKPDNVSVFNSENAPNVTLQTCSGPWDEYRSMYTFMLKEVANG